MRKKWILGAVLAGMVAMPGASSGATPVLWSAPGAVILGHRVGTAFGVRCRVGSRPYIPPGVCLIDTGDLSSGLLITKTDAAWWQIKATGKTQLEGVTGTVSVPTGTTTLKIGGHAVKVNVVIDSYYHGYAVIGPSLLRKLALTMTLNFRTGGVEFHGTPG